MDKKQLHGPQINKTCKNNLENRQQKEEEDIETLKKASSRTCSLTSTAEVIQCIDSSLNLLGTPTVKEIFQQPTTPADGITFVN